jgi:hypothetical protein
MKLAWLGIALLGAALIIYALNRGVYFGSHMSTSVFGSNTPIYAVKCRYLFPSGFHSIYALGQGTGRTPSEARDTEWYCPVFKP